VDQRVRSSFVAPRRIFDPLSPIFLAPYLRLMQVYEESVLRDRIWEWIQANGDIFEVWGSCRVSHLLRLENGFKDHIPKGFLPKSKPEVKMYNWLGKVVGLETFLDDEEQRSFRIVEDTAALTEFENAFVHYVKGHKAGRYFSFVELGQDVCVVGVADMEIEALKARVTKLPYVTVTRKFTHGDSFQVDQSAVTARLMKYGAEAQEENHEEDKDEVPMRKRRRSQ
jgi:hypothetical protein